MPADARKNLVLSFATAAKAEDIRRFVASLREVCPPETTDVVLFVENEERPFARFCADRGVRLVAVPNVWKRISGNLPLKITFRSLLAAAQRLDKAVYRALAEIWVHPQASRYLWFENLLRANPQYGRVLLSDSRDVVFQADPFAALGEDADGVLHVFEQDPSLRYGGDNVDTTWLPRVYDQELLERVRGKPTLCSGTTLAERGVMLDYLAAMSVEVLAHRTTPLDQAMHNKVVHVDWPADRARFHKNVEGPVLTMFGMTEPDYRVGGDGRVYCGERLVPVLHQWDHIQAARRAVLARYENV